MQRTARFLSRSYATCSEGSTIQEHYHLTPPLTHEGRAHDYVIVSASTIPAVVSARFPPVLQEPPETVVFASDATGRRVGACELPGSYTGGLDHTLALTTAGYTITVRPDLDSREAFALLEALPWVERAGLPEMLALRTTETGSWVAQMLDSDSSDDLGQFTNLDDFTRAVETFIENASQTPATPA